MEWNGTILTCTLLYCVVSEVQSQYVFVVPHQLHQWSQFGRPLAASQRACAFSDPTELRLCLAAPDALVEICNSIRTAVRCCPQAYKVWREWAKFNFHLSQCVDDPRRLGEGPEGVAQADGCGYSKCAPTLHCMSSDSLSFPGAHGHRSPLAAWSLEVCPLLAQLQREELADMNQLWDSSCFCACHDNPAAQHHRRQSLFTASKRRLLRRVSSTDQLVKAMKRYKRSLTLNVKQHLRFVCEAAGGFLRSIALRPSKDQDVQELLRLLTVWFRVCCCCVCC